MLGGLPDAGTGGSFTLTLKAHNGVGSDATQTFTLTVGQAPTFSSGDTTRFVAGTAGSFLVTTAGTPAPSLSVTGTLPGGLTFHDNGNGSGVLGGTAASSRRGAATRLT